VVKRWLAENLDHQSSAAWIALLRIWVGAVWLQAGWGKITKEGGWSAAGYLRGIAERDTVPFEFFRGLAESVFVPYAATFSFLVAWGEVLVGLALILGVVTNFAATMGILMNLSFLFAGTVSSNPWFVAIQTVLILGGAGYAFGFDRYLVKYLSIPFILPRYELKPEPRRVGA